MATSAADRTPPVAALTVARTVREPIRGVWLWLSVLVAAVVFASNVHRAWTQSITFDEVTTHHYATGKFDDLFDKYDANHHVLHTYGCRLTVALFGRSEFALRLTSLAGGALYLWMVVRLGRRLCATGPLLLITTLLLSLNPFVLDYLSIARGYGLALALSLVGIEQLLAALSATELPEITRRLRRSSIWLSLAVTANLTLAIFCFWLIIVTAAVLNRRPVGRRISLPHLLRHLARPGFVLFCLLNLVLFKARPGHYYYGEHTLAESVRGFLEASLFHHDAPAAATLGGLWNADRVLLLGKVFVALGSILVFATTARALWAKTRANPDRSVQADFNTDFFLVVGTGLTLTIALTVALHHTIGLLYPKDRTGLYLVPIFCLITMAGLSELLCARSRILRTVAIAGLLLVVTLEARLVAQFPGTYYRTWPTDACGRAMFHSLERLHALQPNRKIRVVGCSWQFMQPLYFYHELFRAEDWLEVTEVGLTKEPPHDTDALLVVDDPDPGFHDKTHVEWFADSTTTAKLLVPREILSPPTQPPAAEQPR